MAKAPAASQETTDPRFASFATDPRFRLPSKKDTRTKIDKRFSRMLKDDEFINTARVDRYGRELDHSSKKQALQRLYQAEKDFEDYKDRQHEELKIEVTDEVVTSEPRRAGAKHDPAREGGYSSSDDESEDQENGIEEDEEPEFPDLLMEQAVVPMGEVTSRLAVVNLDWDNIKAVDLMAVFSSFIRSGGMIERVAVYKSEFGKERMEREAIEGPPREIFTKKSQEGQTTVDTEDEGEDKSEDDEEDKSEDDEEVEERIKKELVEEDTGKEYDSSALRQYQLERLRYYYAVVVCSDKDTARQVYESTDGTEYLSSANFLDLRFIPDDTEFDSEPRDECASVPPGYKPTEFVTDALQHSNVKLTWDAEDPSRKDVIKRAFTGSRANIAENDLKAYIGSDSSDSEEEAIEGASDCRKLTKKEQVRQRMRAAFGLPEEPIDRLKEPKLEPAGDMEITFTAGLSNKEKGSVFENSPIKEETTAETYIRKEKGRKARRKEKAKARREGRNPEEAPDDIKGPEEQKPSLGFDDPFFNTDEATKTKVARSARKEARRLNHKAKVGNDSERAALKFLMADNGTEGQGARLDHFDMNEIARAEKRKGKKKKNRGKPGDEDGEDGEPSGLQEGFEMDAADPRFAAVFESHEFAIDPSNPKFKGTAGMKKILEEGRKRKASGDVYTEPASARAGRQEKAGAPDGDTSLKELVGILKKKVKQ